MNNDFKFRYYTREELEISSIDSKLTENEKKIRRHIMNYIINNKKPYNLNENLSLAMNKLKLSEDDLNSLFNSLIDKNVIVTDKNDDITFIYPISAIKTNHKVILEDGREFFSMCAIDSIGSSFTFKQDVKIVSICSNTNKPIHIEVIDGRLKENYKDITILHVDLKKIDDWSGTC